MINHYEIKKSNNEEILILYLDIAEEFSLDFKNNDKYKEFKYQLKKIIDTEKYVGQKIVLVVGGIIIGSLLFLNPAVDETDFSNYVFVDNNITLYNDIAELTEQEEIQEVVTESDKEEIKEVIEETVNESSQSVTGNTNANNVTKNNTTSNNNNTSKNNTTTNSNVNNTVNTNQAVEDSNESSSIETEKDLNTQTVTVYRSNGNVVTLSMTEYLIGVVAAEMPASFNVEALKAQAILSRTYAMKKIEKSERLTDTVSTQRYKDNSELKSMWGSDYQKYYSKIKQAVESTDGITLKYKGSYIEAVYHSTSNGKTEAAINVWGNSVPYLVSVDSNWDSTATSYLRTENKDLNNVLNLLGITSDDISFEITSRNASGRVETIKVGDSTFTGIEFRTLLGLRSADFDISVVNNEVVITTRGYGHGVGMSQYGANGMANEGYSYSQILSHYYPGTYQEKV